MRINKALIVKYRFRFDEEPIDPFSQLNYNGPNTKLIQLNENGGYYLLRDLNFGFSNKVFAYTCQKYNRKYRKTDKIFYDELGRKKQVSEKVRDTHWIVYVYVYHVPLVKSLRQNKRFFNIHFI